MTMQKMLLLPAAVVGIVTCLTMLFQPISAQTLNNPDLNNLKTDLVAFDTYEDMHEYVANRVQRGLRHLDNPTDDSYIEAFNQHNEQPSQESLIKRQKRQIKQRSLPNEPRLFRFEISDAVEPNDEVKQLIKKHRSRELMLEKGTTTRPEKTNSGNRNVMRLTTTVEKQKSFRAGRTRRRVPRTPAAKFPVHLIPFEASDAREPDEATKRLIKRMRALELEQLHQIQATTKPTLAPLPKPQRTPPTEQPVLAKPTTAVPSLSPSLSRPKAGKLRMKTMRKRTRRSASQHQRSAPQMFKFELEDAKEPDQSIKALMEQQNLSRESRQMKTNTTRFERKSDSSDSTSELEDQSSEESKRYYFYKESPVKSKKSVNSLPHQVQKAITHLFKDKQGAKAYVKYLPAQKMDYNHLRSVAYSGAKAAGSIFHGQNGANVAPAYVKYVQVAPQPQVHQVQIHPVPVVEKVRYVYAAAPSHEAHAQAYAPQHYVAVQHTPVHQRAAAHPIIVPEPGYAKQAPAQIAEVHHTYSADLAYAQKAVEAEEAANAQQFHASKPDPYYEENKVGAELDAAAEAEPEAEAPQEQQDAPAAEHNYVPVEDYKYELYSKVPQGYIAEGKGKQPEQTAEPTPLIKIEYHAAPDVVKQNYKELAEFKQLSALMGKSPEDQFHGLTYLIAKEMQAKRQQQRQQKKFADEATAKHRPQDNTSPILFHPSGSGEEEQKAVASSAEVKQQIGQKVRLIGMGKSKQYIPIVEQIESKAAGAVEANEQQQHQIYAAPIENKNYAAQESPKYPAASSFVHYDLSPNYEGGGKAQQNAAKAAAPQVLHHHSLTHHGHGGAGGAYKIVKSNQYGGGGDGAVAASHADVEIELEHNGGASDGIIKHGKTLHFRTKIDEREAVQYASKYAFGYRIRDFNTGNDFGHKQNRDLDGVTRGQYHILLPDGRIQNVIYHADDTGFHADVSFETGH